MDPPRGNEAARLAPTGAWPTYRRLLGYLRPHRAMFLLGVLGMIMFAATDAGWAAFVRFFLDGTFVERDPRMVWLVPAALVGLFLLRGIGDFLQTYCPGHVGRHIVKTLRAEIFDRYLHLPVAFFDSQASGTLLSRLTYNTEQVAQATTDSITVFIRDTLTIVGLVGYLFYMNWRLTLFSLIVGPLIALLIRRINHLFRRYSARIQDSMGDVTRVAKEAIEAPRVVRVFNAQDHQAQVFEIGDRAQPALAHEDDAHPGAEQSGGAAGRVDRPRRRAVRRDARRDAGQDDGRRVHLVHRRADADHGAIAQAGQRRRPAAAGHRRGAEHLRDPRRAHRSRRAADGRSTGRAATSSTATCDSAIRRARTRCCAA